MGPLADCIAKKRENNPPRTAQQEAGADTAKDTIPASEFLDLALALCTGFLACVCVSVSFASSTMMVFTRCQRYSTYRLVFRSGLSGWTSAINTRTVLLTFIALKHTLRRFPPTRACSQPISQPRTRCAAHARGCYHGLIEISSREIWVRLPAPEITISEPFCSMPLRNLPRTSFWLHWCYLFLSALFPDSSSSQNGSIK
jgi:hypothetical protein